MESPTDPQAADFLPLNDANARRFVEAFAGRVAAHVARFRLPHDLSQDVVQEALLRALRALPNFRGESKLTTWLYSIAWREGARAHRRLQRHREREGALPDAAEPAAQGPSAVDRAADADDLARVRAALGRLPDTQRLALGYHYLDGLPVAEIAALMDVAPNTVKSWLKRGRDRVRQWCDDPGDPDSRP